MIARPFLFALILGGFSFQAGAQTFLLTGELDDDGAPADGLFAFDFALLNDADAVIWSEQQPSVVVAQGSFAVDVGAATPLPSVAPLSARLQVTVGEDVLPPFPLARFLSVNRAARAQRALTSPRTVALAGVTEGEVVTRTDLATAGSALVPFTNVSGLGDDVRDGDDGVDVTNPVDGLALGGGALSVASVNGDRFGANTIDGGRLPDSSLAASKLGQGVVTGAKVGSDLTRGDLAADITLAEIAGQDIFRVVSVGCEDLVNKLSTQPTCATTICTFQSSINGQPVTLVGRRACGDATACSSFNPTACTNSLIGKLVAP